MKPEDLTAYLDGELSPEEAERVERALEQDPALRQRLAELCSQRLLLAEAFRESGGGTEEGRQVKTPRAIRRIPLWVHHRRQSWASPGVFWGGLAAGLALALLGLVLSRRGPGRDLVRKAREAAPARRTALPETPPGVPSPAVAEPVSEGPGPRPEAPPPAPEGMVVAAPDRSAEVPSIPRRDPVPPAEEGSAPRPPEVEVVGLFQLREVRGEVWIVKPAGKSPARAGDWVGLGQTLEVAGRAEILYPDGTWVEVEADSELAPVEGEGKRLRLLRGALRAQVARQPAKAPMVFLTPQAEAVILGTTLRLVVEGEATRLEVLEGKVRLRRVADGRFVDVPAGHCVVAAAGTTLAVRPLEIPEPIVLEVEEFGTGRGIQPADGPVRRPFLEPLPGASGGWCVAVPGIGTEVAGDFTLPQGLWHLWIRYRDENMGAVAFDVLVNGKLLGGAAGTGKSKDWIWRRFSFPAEGKVRLVVRSTTEAVRQTDPGKDPQKKNPYGVVNRWDRVVLTRDAGYSPER